MKYLNLNDFQKKLSEQADSCKTDKEAMALIRKLMDDSSLIIEKPTARWDIEIETDEDGNKNAVYCCTNCSNALEFPILDDMMNSVDVSELAQVVPSLLYCPFCDATMSNPDGDDSEEEYPLAENNDIKFTPDSQITQVVDLTEYIQEEITKTLAIEKMKKKIKKEVKKEVRKQLQQEKENKPDNNQSAN